MTTKVVNIEKIRHSTAHLLAAAAQKLHPEAKFGVGPAVEDGFYYDIDLPSALTADDLQKIEKEMRKLQQQNLLYEREEMPIEEAIILFKKLGQDYKVELLQDLMKHGTTAASEIYGNEDEKEKGKRKKEKINSVSIYKTGDFIDLCRGPHVGNAKEIRAFKLTKLAGAYWRGNAGNKMMQRVYGTAFATQAELDKYLAMLEEAKKRDHKILGRELGLFTFSPEVGSGFPLYLPKGAILRTLILDYVTKLKIDRGYSFVWTPHLAKEELYVRSGHLGKYDAMLPAIEAADERLVVKPMNCPHHFEIYRAQPHSYKDLPVRLAENATDYRNEKTGELNGLFRVRALTQDDTHHIVRPDQVASEIDMVLALTREIYEKFSFKNFHVEISTWDPKSPKKYFGSPQLWENAQNALIEGAKRWGAPYRVVEGEAAFYGPKIDIRVEDALGRDWQLTTVQLDYNQPENFDLYYIDKDGKKARPAVLHVAILGSVDRFMGIIIEHYAGAFPVWLSPVQIALLPVSNEKHLDFTKKLAVLLKEKDARVWIDDSDETVGKKIRSSEQQKIPFMLVLGDKEMSGDKLAVRQRGLKDTKEMTIEELISRLRR